MSDPTTSLFTRRAELEGMTEFPSYMEYARMWRDLAREFSSNGLESAAASCLRRATHYESAPPTPAGMAES